MEEYGKVGAGDVYGQPQKLATRSHVGAVAEKDGPSVQDYAGQLHMNVEHLRDRVSELRNRLETVLRPSGPTPVDDRLEKRPQAALSPLAGGILASHAMVDELHGIVNDICRRLHL
jgi:ubiquinone biosynthesis protein UbiJ